LFPIIKWARLIGSSLINPERFIIRRIEKEKSLKNGTFSDYKKTRILLKKRVF